MDRKDRIGRLRVEESFAEGFARARVALLARLKEELHRTRERVAVAVEQVCSTDEHCRVSIVTTRVHATLRARCERKVVVLGHRQRIHVRAQQNRRAGEAAAQRCYEASGRLALAYFEVEAGELKISLHDYSMQDIVNGVISDVNSLAAEKNLTLNAIVPPDLPTGFGDDRRISQVLLNLVGNAIKFSDEGEVSVRVSASDGEFQVAVADTGIGISAADQAEILNEFYQADNSSTRAHGGTGLGLAIAKRIVELLGGCLWIESALGEGSTFSFSLPIRAEQNDVKSGELA